MLNIITLIPQRPPFVMIGKLLHSDDVIIRTSFLITEENVMLDNGEFTEGGLMENIAQTAAARAGFIARQEQKPVADGYIASVKNFEIYALPKVNDEIVTEIRIENQVLGATIISGTITCNNAVLAKCEMSIFTGNDA